MRRIGRFFIILFLQVITLGVIFVGMAFDNKWVTKNANGKFKIVTFADEKHDLEFLKNHFKNQEKFDDFIENGRVILKNSLLNNKKLKMIVLFNDGGFNEETKQYVGKSVIFDAGDASFSGANSIPNIETFVKMYASNHGSTKSLGIEDGSAVIPFWAYAAMAVISFIGLAVFIFVPKPKKREFAHYKKNKKDKGENY